MTSSRGPMPKRSPYGTEGAGDAEVLGVLTGQVPVKSAPVAMKPPIMCREPGCYLWSPHSHDGVSLDEDAGRGSE